MPDSLHLATDVPDPALGSILSEEFPEISIGFGAAGADQADAPHICFLDDRSSAAGIIERIQTVRRDFPKSSIFVVSDNAAPDHIVEVMKTGASEFFIRPVSPEKLRQAVGRVQLQILQAGGGEEDGSVFAFLGTKGGLGATVLAVNTATALAARKAGRTALLDLSLQAGDSSVLLDLVPKTTMTDIARNFDRLDAALVAGIMEKHPAGIDVLAAPASPAEAGEISAEQIEKTLKLCRGMYRQIVVDCPSMSVDERARTVFQAAARIFIVTDLSVTAVRNAARLLKFFLQNGYGSRKVEIVANRFSKGQAGTIEEVEKTLGRRLFWLFPNDFDGAMASINRGTPLVKFDPRSPLARSISDFARKLGDPEAFPNYRGIKGLLGKAI